MDEQNVAYPHSGVLFHCETEWRTDVYYNVAEAWKYNAE